MTICEIEQRLRRREVSCVELIQEVFRAIREREHWNCFITQTEESALKEAAERDRELASGLDRGPLHGVPIAFKDLFYTCGVRTTAGSLIYRDFVPQQDGAVVADQKSRGAVSIGKTNLHELAFGITSQNPHFGPVLNPLDETRIAGGSSGGSAALVAAGLVPLAWGTDTGGSIRIPASYCGVVGLKPTYGLLSTAGILPLSWSLDHAGPIGTTVEDCALALGLSLKRRTNLEGVRIGVPRNFFFDRVDTEIAKAVEDCVARMERAGAVVSRVQLPDLVQAGAAARLIQWAEVSAQYGKYDREMFGDDVWALVQQGLLVAAHDYVNAQRVRSLFRREFDELWRTVDVLVTPTTPITAPKRTAETVLINGEEENTRIASTRLVRAINLLGEPAISIPYGRDSQEMPIGVQLVAKPHADRELLEIADYLSS
jgi:aspartyl-tRNA(Asn)/glutamyl-tRNA(Gln) amidotransferase subunit A